MGKPSTRYHSRGDYTKCTILPTGVSCTPLGTSVGDLRVATGAEELSPSLEALVGTFQVALLVYVAKFFWSLFPRSLRREHVVCRSDDYGKLMLDVIFE